MPQVTELYIKVKDAEAKAKIAQVDKQVQNLEQRFAKSFTVSTNAKGLDTAIEKFVDAEGRLVTLKQQEVEVTRKITDETGKQRKIKEIEVQETKSVSTNYAEIARLQKQITKETEQQEQATRRLEEAQKRFQASLTGSIRTSYKNGSIDGEQAARLQDALNSFHSQYSTKYWQDYWNGISGIGDRAKITAQEVSIFGQLSDEAFQKYSTGAMTADEANKSVEKSTDRAGESAQRASKQFTLLYTIFLRLAHTAITAVTRAFRESLQEMKNVDTQLTTISRITKTSISDLDGLKQKAYEVGSSYGVLASDYLSAAAAFTRAGYREQAEDLAELSSKLQIAGQVSAETANQLLIATDKAYQFNGSVTKLSEVMDKMTVIDHNYATSVEKIAEGIGLVAPIASQAHMSMDELIASLGTITAVTQRSGSESARAMRALILSIIKDTTTEIEEGVTWTVEEINSLQDALKLYAPEVVKAAEATGSLIDPMEAIAALAKSYEDGLLTEAKLAALTSKLGGKLRSSQLLSLIQNYSGMYTQMMNDMGNAIGAVDEDVDKALQSWQVKLNQLKNTFTKFVEETVSTDIIKGLLDAINWIISGIGNIGNALTILGATIVALNFTRIIGWFGNLSKIITAAGGGLKGLIITLTNYKTISKAGAVGTEAFNTALSGTSLAASAAQIGISILAIAITGLIIGINKAKQAEEERRRAAIEAAKDAAQEIKEINELKTRYDILKKAFENGTGTREEYEAAQDAIIQKLKDEGVWTGDAKEGYDKLTESIEKNTEAARKNREIEVYRGLQSAGKNLTDTPASQNWLYSGYTKGEVEDAIWYYMNGYLERPNWMPYVSRDSDMGIDFGYNFESLFGKDSETQILRTILLYEDLEEQQRKLFESGQKDTQMFEAVSTALEYLKPNYESYKTLVEEYFSLLDDESIKELQENGGLYATLFEKWGKSGKDDADEASESIDKISSSLNGLTDELKKATTALDKYKKALEGGEKGDTFKSYAEAYKKATELFEKGLTGSNAYMSAIDLLIPADVMQDLEWNYEEAGKLLGNDFVKAMFSEGGDDYGANAANYIRQHLDQFRGVAIEEAEDGTFGLVVTDMSEFAKSTGLSEEALWSLMDALDIFHSEAVYSFSDLMEMLDSYSDSVTELENGFKRVDVTTLINHLVQDGKTDREIKSILGSLEKMSGIEMNYPENLDKTLKDVREINEQAEENPELEVVISSNKDDFFNDLYRACETFDGTVYVGLKVKSDVSAINRANTSIDLIAGTVSAAVGGTHGGHSGKYANGTDNASGGLALVNDGNGAELIAAGDRAYVVGGGKPTITNLPAGATVYTAEETRAIFSRSGIPAFKSGIKLNRDPLGRDNYTYGGDVVGGAGTYAGGIPDAGNKPSPDNGKTGNKKLDKILDELSKYIDKILKKAKDALDKQLKAIDEQIDALQREHDADEDANKLEELRLKILEAEKNLVDAQNERTVRYFNKQTGQWEWMADQKAVYEAQEALKKAQEAYDKEVAEQAYQAQIQALKDLKDMLQNQYNGLAEHWQEILTSIQESEDGTIDFESLINRLGLDSKSSGDIRDLIKAIQDYENNLKNGTYTVPLDGATASKLFGTYSSTGVGETSVAKMFGLSTGDANAKGNSIYSTTTSSVVGDTVYYINGVKIGNDLMDKPLSQILSVLPIYAN